MSEKEKIKVAVIPKGTSVSIMGCSYTLLEDAKTNGDQDILNATLKAQKDYKNGVNVCSGSGATFDQSVSKYYEA